MTVTGSSYTLVYYSNIDFSEFEKDNGALIATSADIIISWNRINDIKTVINKFGFNYNE